ncbi:lipoprotein [Amycolatopsis sp. NPDC059657]|uniref:lipoprotein n=1 Tax=Amycolatopsis sp. NPDC059657 TaxID=3346899 RepID=UPI00366CED4C
MTAGGTLKGVMLLTTVLLAAGCGSDVGAQPRPQPKGNEIGPAGSACPMPITFQLLDGWHGVRQRMKTRQGDVLCEVLVGPTMDSGSVRIYRVPGVTEPKAALEPLVEMSPGAENKVYQQVSVGSGAAT